MAASYAIQFEFTDVDSARDVMNRLWDYIRATRATRVKFEFTNVDIARAVMNCLEKHFENGFKGYLRKGTLILTKEEVYELRRAISWDREWARKALSSLLEISAQVAGTVWKTVATVAKAVAKGSQVAGIVKAVIEGVCFLIETFFSGKSAYPLMCLCVSIL